MTDSRLTLQEEQKQRADTALDNLRLAQRLRDQQDANSDLRLMITWLSIAAGLLLLLALWLAWKLWGRG